MRSKSPEWLANREYMLSKLEEIKRLPQVQQGMHLHLGCGSLIYDGFLNVDKYIENEKILKYDLSQMPFWNNSIATIYSSHSLEHLPIRHANATLAHWYNLLQKDGMLYLAVPDLEEVCAIMLDPEVGDNLKWEWYIYVLFGYQIPIGTVTNIFDKTTTVDLGQFHCTGFSKKRLMEILTFLGFKIEKCINYDGWDTPSIWIEARK